MADQIVYLMLNSRNGYVKIGKSKNPIFREKTLQSEEPEVVLIGTCACISEKTLHRKFATRRLRGEWFAIGGDLLADLLLDFTLTGYGLWYIKTKYGVDNIEHLGQSMLWIEEAKKFDFAFDEDLLAVSLV